MGFWHTGYAEFHESSGLGEYVYTPPPPVRYACEHCAKSFSDLEALRKHRFEEHPLRQPALLLRGKPVGALPQILLTPLDPSDVLVEDATSCLLNGEPVPTARLAQQLAVMRREFADVELSNQGATTRLQLDFRVADEAHLAGVETAFLRLARSRVLNIDAISRFNDDCRAFASAMPYCDGISHYLYGVMAKERSTDSGLAHEKYVERFSRCADELAGLDRTLAHSVRALVAFNFNHFEDAEDLAPEGALRQTAGSFAGLLHGLPWHFGDAFSPVPGGVTEDLLTDQDTRQILFDASQGLVELKHRAEELFLQLRASAGSYDHMKRLLLTCEAYAARDDEDSHRQARKLARELAANPTTATWSNAMLLRLTPHDK